MKILRPLLLLLLLVFSSGLYSQSVEDKRWAISLHGGTAILQGTGDIGTLNGAGGASIKYSLANNFSLRVQGYSGIMNSVKDYYKSKTTFFEGNAQALLNIVNFKKPSTGRNIAQLYVGLGLGYSIGYLRYTQVGSYIVSPTTSSATIIIPMSGGIRFYISPLIDLGLEYTTRSTFVNDFDGGASPSAPAGTSSAGKFYDFYNMPHAYITFNIGKNSKARNLEWTEATEKLYEELLKAKQEAQDQIKELKTENHELVQKMKIDLDKQMAENKRKSDSLIVAVRESFKNDGDGDGVSDVFDKEPNTPAGATVDGSGRMMDSDKDGIPDYLDKCPTVPGKAANNGCPLQPTKQQLAVLTDGIKNLQFETGQAIIKSTSFPALDALAQMLVENSSFAFRIEGHTDNVGDPKANMVLSLNRADAVKSYLVSKGVEDSRITAKGFGDTKPVVSNDTAAGKAKNRRVDMTIE